MIKGLSQNDEMVPVYLVWIKVGATFAHLFAHVFYLENLCENLAFCKNQVFAHVFSAFYMSKKLFTKRQWNGQYCNIYPYLSVIKVSDSEGDCVYEKEQYQIYFRNNFGFGMLCNRGIFVIRMQGI